MLDLLGWIGNLFFIYGAYALSVKNIKGFYAQVFGNLFYVIQAYLMLNWSLLFLSIILAIISGYGIYNWGRKCRCEKNKVIEDANFKWVESVLNCYEDKYLKDK